MIYRASEDSDQQHWRDLLTDIQSSRQINTKIFAPKHYNINCSLLHSIKSDKQLNIQ